ncbi:MULTISPECIES: phage tail assembly chaperone [Paenochrobactrum]|uniref:phage tail assembly chaperone n=1 Tax=Paenochrobactrum pullorum TaxID=1324351 RepID=UPI004044E964
MGTDNLRDLPDAFQYLWQWFMDLNASRSTGMSVSPISWAEIEAYSSGLQLGIKPWERRILRDMDTHA